MLLLTAVHAAQPPGPRAVHRSAMAWFNSLTPAQRVAQLVMVPFYGDAPNPRSPAWREYESLVRELGVGGLIVLNRVRDGVVERADPYQMAAFLNRMQRLARVPLIVGGDFERGASMRMTSTVPFPHAMAFAAGGDLEGVRRLGLATAREARSMGVHWIFAPDADVNNNPDNPIINIRSFGEDPQQVAAFVRAFIEGAHSDPANRVLVTVKHFPGHGDTAVDSHIGLGVIEASRERLERVELAPFRAAIEAGVDAIMTAHLAVPALEEERIPATVSRRIMTGLLREQLRFQGILTTDAMDMQGLTQMFPPGEAAVRALEAGNDLLLIPQDPRAAVRAVLEALNSGRLDRRQVDRSVIRILEAKVRVGLHVRREVRIESIPDALLDPDDLAAARTAAQRAITVVKNNNRLIPLKNREKSCWFILSGSRFSTQGQGLLEELRSRRVRNVTLLDPQLPETEFAAQAEKAAACETAILGAYVTASAYRGNVDLAGNYPAFVKKLLAGGRPVVFLALGNPYLLRTYPDVAAYLATFSTARVSEEAAVRAVLGEAPVTGRLPVTIPGLATAGFGIMIEKPE
ncbi:MAG: glycoside hydrolase family 3 N-terminal domain-containing protein [Acidobacteriota bacterium]